MCRGVSGSQIASVSVTVMTNSVCDPAQVTMEKVPVTEPLDDDAAGQVKAKAIDMTPFSACFAGWGWKVIMTTLEGEYSLQYRVFDGTQEAGNPTEDNFCRQVDDLFRNNPYTSGEHWSMLQAVIDHELEHVKDAEFALQEKAQKYERYLELLWAEDAVGTTQAEAMAAMKPEDIEQAQNACLFDWVRRYPDIAEASHTCRTIRAQRLVLNPKFEEICHEALTTWPASYEQCVMCSQIGPPPIPDCPPRQH